MSSEYRVSAISRRQLAMPCPATKQIIMHGIIAFTRRLIILQLFQNSTIQLLFLTPQLAFTKDVSLTLLKTSYAQARRARHCQVARSARPAPPPRYRPYPVGDCAVESESQDPASQYMNYRCSNLSVSL